MVLNQYVVFCYISWEERQSAVRTPSSNRTVLNDKIYFDQMQRRFIYFLNSAEIKINFTVSLFF